VTVSQIRLLLSQEAKQLLQVAQKQVQAQAQYLMSMMIGAVVTVLVKLTRLTPLQTPLPKIRQSVHPQEKNLMCMILRAMMDGALSSYG
jgi:hypothetical protein